MLKSPLHCEAHRAEAIQPERAANEKLDCFASLAMTNND
jgi:hypothetical protein